MKTQTAVFLFQRGWENQLTLTAVEASLALKHLPERKGPSDRVLVADSFPIGTSFMP